MKKEVVGLVSGGKDSCFAMMKCLHYGYQVPPPPLFIHSFSLSLSLYIYIYIVYTLKK